MKLKLFDMFIKERSTSLEDGSYFKRRKPEDSKITIEQIQNLSLKELYNFIRALTDPYPNAYIEDTEGNKLIFKKVLYIPKDK